MVGAAGCGGGALPLFVVGTLVLSLVFATTLAALEGALAAEATALADGAGV